jgi:hypothetical protein
VQPRPRTRASSSRVAGFEIKAGTRIKDPDLNGLRLLRDRLGDRFVGGFILNLGELAYRKEERITILPLSALWSLPNSPALSDLNLAQLADEMPNLPIRPVANAP